MGPTSAEYIIFLSFPRLIYERLFLQTATPFTGYRYREKPRTQEVAEDRQGFISLREK
jgi:hypothetical protein